MTKAESKPLEIQASTQNVFAFLSNFNNLGKLIPSDLITNWHSTEDNCSFTIPNMATLAVRIKEKIEPTKLVITSKPPSPFQFDLICEFEALMENSCRSAIRFHANINPMIAMMIKNPMNNFVNMLNEQLQQYFADKETE